MSTKNGTLRALVFSATLSSFIFGAILASTNTTVNFICTALDPKWNDDPKYFTFNHDACTKFNQIQTALTMIAAGMGSWCGGYVANYFGRRGGLLLSSTVGTVVFLLMGAAQSLTWFYVMRFMSGLVLGVVAVLVPMYITEVTPDQHRGSYGIVHQLQITIGILCGVLLGLPQSTIDWKIHEANPRLAKSDFTDLDLFWWRVVLAFPAVPALLSMVLFGLVYRRHESPVHLYRTGRKTDAQEIIEVLPYGPDEYRNMEAAQAQGTENKGFVWAWNSVYRPGVLLGSMLCIMQQASGVNVVVSQSNQMFASMGGGISATTLSDILWALNVIMTFPAIPLVDSYGRRTLLLGSSLGCFLSMAIGYLFGLFFPAHAQVVGVICLFMFQISFAVGLGPVVWLYVSEIYPAKIRGSCMSVATLLNWCSSASMNYGVIPFLSSISTTFLVLAIANLIVMLFIYQFIVETSGTDPEKSPIYAGRGENVALLRGNDEGGKY